MTPVARGVLWYVSYVIKGHPGHRNATREALGLCSRIVFWAVLSLGVSSQTVFLYHMSVKYTFTFKWQFLGSKCITNRFLYIIWRLRAILLCSQNIMGYIIKLGSIFFLFSLALNLVYIDSSLCQIWRACMQYLWCCGHSNKCLFLVIQQTKVLLNFLVSV